MKYQLKILSGDKEILLEANHEDNLLKILQTHNFNLPALCGANRSCGKCKIKVLEGSLTPADAEKELLSISEINDGIRLACFHKIDNDLKISFPKNSEMKILTKSTAVNVELDALIKRKIINIDRPRIDDQRDLLKRIKENNVWLKSIKNNLLNELFNLSDEKEIKAVVNQGEVIDFQKTDQNSGIYGFAVDIGTTTVVMYLLNLLTGEEVDLISFANPQKDLGADVITRINYTLDHEAGIKILQQKLIDSLNREIDKILGRNSVKRNNIYQMSIVGNTVMMHFLLAVSAEGIAKSPYIPVFTEELKLTTADLAFKINKNAVIKIHPSISSYVGADIAADITAADYEKYSCSLLIDIGTNGEIVLFKEDKIYACSAAAGPAFEGAKIRDGSAGVPGAIAAFDENGYQTIDNQVPHGICGSGLLDIVGYLLENNYINEKGAFNNKEDLSEIEQQNIIQYKGRPAFKVVSAEETANSEAIILTQKDIREFQLAKSAIAAGIQILIQKAGLKTSEIETIYLAGGFGNYINIDNAKKVGLIPNLLTENAIKMGNGAGQGAKIYLLNKAKADKAAEIAADIEYIELSKLKSFQEYFMKNMLFDTI